MSDYEKVESQLKANTLIPGDLILIRTPSAIYEVFRKLGAHKYDHIVTFSVHTP